MHLSPRLRHLSLSTLALACASAWPQDAEPEPPRPQTIEIQGQRVRNAAGKQTLTREELQRIPGSSGDPMKAVMALPGLATTDDSSSAPAVRGARPQDNGYYVDFLPVGYLFHLGGFASTFNPELIRRFDLASAAWSPEYGDVVGAVFDISLRNPRSDRIGGKLDFSLLGASVLAEGPINERLSFFVAGRRSWFDLVTKTAEDKEEGVTYTVPVFNDSQGRLLWTLSTDHRLRLDFSAAADRIDFSTQADSKAAQRDPALLGNSNQRQSYRNFALSWDGEFGSLASNQLALGQMSNREFARIGTAGTYDAEVTTTYLREQLRLAWSREHASTLGGALNSRLVELDLDFQDPRCTEFDPNCDISSAGRVTSLQKTRQNQAEAYANHRWRLSPGWTATGGLRVSRDQYVRQTFTEPRLGLEWNLSPRTMLSLGVGRHNQPPPVEQALRDIGNPQLAHLRSTHRVLGLTQTLDAGWSVRAEVYGKTFDGYAVDDALLKYRNGGSGTAQGFELLVKKDGSDKLTGFFSLSVSKARRRNDLTGETFRFDYDQPVIATLVGQYKQSDAWTWGAKWSYHTGSPYTPVVGTGSYPDGRVKPVYGAINSQRVPAYHRLDLRLDRKVSPHFTQYFELINAYNRKNVAGYSYSPDYQTREEVYQLPVLVSFGLQYSF
jgi:TonB dependent receptor/TonB-dependent Receptor Plug Domain